MTGNAIVAVPCTKHALVIIRMTICAPIVCQLQPSSGNPFWTGFVAFFARYCRMASNKFERCLIMIELSILSRCVPSFRRVARSALLLHEFVRMGRDMAWSAIGKFFGSKQNRFSLFLVVKVSVAFVTRYWSMFANKSVVRFSMVKHFRGRPRLRRMTRLTFLPHCIIVPIGVTTHARLVQSEKRLAAVGVNNLQRLGIFDVLFRMTIFTLYCCMFAEPGKASLRVIEGVLIELHRLRVAAKMFLVTRNALLRCIPEMKSVSTPDHRHDFLVTCLTFFSTDLVACFMALQAVVHPFKFLMRP